MTKDNVTLSLPNLSNVSDTRSEMPELYNANPVIISPAQHSVRKGKAYKVDLWADGLLNETAESLDVETTDPIDEQEVFGAP